MALKLGMANKSLAAVIGVSEATVSRMRSGAYTLQRGQKSFELATLFVRFYRSLDAIVGGDQEVARAWLKNPNTALASAPLTLIQTVPGRMNAICSKAHSAAWSHPTDYSQYQALAASARMAAIESIRYRSVRDPKKRMNLALLTCRAFAKPEPPSLQTWRIHLRATGAQAICESPKSGIAFDRDIFAADPRIAALKWNR
jgi:hypothetical protein